MNERLIQIRKSLSMTRQTFGESLGVSGDVVNNWERGRVEIKEPFVKLICSTYNINEIWMRTGEGEMHSSLDREQEIALIASSIIQAPDDDFKYKLIKLISEMTPEQIQIAKNIAKYLANDLPE